MEELFFLVEESPEGGFSARALGQSIFTQGETLDEVRDAIRDAVECHFSDAKPKMLHLHIVRDEILAYA
jgi:predicted RNase H-like HicB family nuclease